MSKRTMIDNPKFLKADYGEVMGGKFDGQACIGFNFRIKGKTTSFLMTEEVANSMIRKIETWKTQILKRNENRRYPILFNGVELFWREGWQCDPSHGIPETNKILVLFKVENLQKIYDLIKVRTHTIIMDFPKGRFRGQGWIDSFDPDEIQADQEIGKAKIELGFDIDPQPTWECI